MKQLTKRVVIEYNDNKDGSVYLIGLNHYIYNNGKEYAMIHDKQKLIKVLDTVKDAIENI